jgi:large subunit ribosomal protein L25
MSEFVLEVKERQPGEQSRLTNLRTKSRVPGIVYGFGHKNNNIEADYNTLLKVLIQAGTSHLVVLKLGSQNIKTIVRGYQQDPVSDRVIHVDFLATNEKRKLTTKVPLEFSETSKAVREKGALLDIKNNTVKVKCLPADLPAVIKVDVSALEEIGQGIKMSGLQISDKVKILNNPNDPVVDVIIPKKIQVTTAEVAQPVAGAEAVVEGEAPKEGEEAKASEAAKLAEGKEGKAGETAKPAAAKK